MNIFSNFISSIFQSKRDQLFSSIMSRNTPVYTSFGNDVYISDIVRHAFSAIARETSKISLKSVIENDKPHTITVSDDSVTQLFKCKPNPLMTTQEFFYKIAWLRKMNLNAFIYPQYKVKNGKKEFTGFYPLDPKIIEFSYSDSEIYIKMTFNEGITVTLPYCEIIHLRDNFSLNEFVGGNSLGQPENREVLKTVEILDKVMQGMPKAITASLEMKGIYKVKSQIDRDKLDLERDSFEKALTNSKSGIVALGYDGDYTPANVTPQLIPKDILDWLETKVLKNYGVSMAIVCGDFSEEQFSAFFQTCVEDFIINAEQAFTGCLFTSEQQKNGCRIKIYDRLVQHLSMETKLKILQIVAPMGAFGKDEVRELIGYEPTGDNAKMQSLNWIDTALAPDYQMQRRGVTQSPSPSTLPTDTSQQETIVNSTERIVGEKLNGAQIQSLIQVTQSVASGGISRESALAILTATLGISQEVAEKILGNAKPIIEGR